MLSTVISYAQELPNARGSVAIGRRTIVTFAAEWFSGDDLHDIEIAVGEALANCVEHALDAAPFVAVCCCFDGAALHVDITDGGAGFDERVVRERAVGSGRSDRGHGLLLMRRCMDDVEFRDGGARVVLRKHRR